MRLPSGVGRQATGWITAIAGMMMLLTACAPSQVAPTSGHGPLQRGWTAVGLGFLPAAINDAEVIVGSNTQLGAVRYHNGSAVGLPHINHSTTGGPYQAVDINASGDVLGIPDQQGLALYSGVTWSPPTFNASVIGKAPVGFFVPGRINNSRLVIGWAGDALLAWKWTFTQGFKELKAHQSGYFARPTDVNDAGVVVGYDETNAAPGMVLRWDANGTVMSLDTASGLRGHPRIRNNGEVVWANAAEIKRWNSGTITTATAPAGFQQLTAVSDAGRLAGTLMENGVRRGWTSFQGGLAYLDAPNAAPGDYVEPTGINNCGSIVGIVHRSNGNPDYGVYFQRTGIMAWCDTPPVATQ